MASTTDAAFAFAGHDDWARVVPAARQVLASEPEDANAHALLALGLAHLDQAREAVAAGRRAVALAPELAFAHYAHAWALIEHDEITAAERAAKEALRLDPGADQCSLLAHVRIRQRRWKDALEIAERGLNDDPEHQGCSNFRALALTNLGQTNAATDVVHEALAFDPDDAYAHANRGWLLLRESNVEEALESFQSALRLDPTMEWARTGIIEAMKARNGPYRLILRYSLWTSTLSKQAMWGFVLGFFFVSRIARATARENPSWWPVFGPLIALYVLFVFGSWIAHPVSNLMLRLNPIGKLALNRAETLTSSVVGACLAITAVAGLVFLATNATPWLILAAVSAMLLIPVGAAGRAHGTRAWRPLSITVLILGAIGAGSVILAFAGVSAAQMLFVAFLVGSFLYTWSASYLLIKYE